MLITGDCYYDMYLKGRNIAEIEEELCNLRRELHRLKTKIESPYYEFEEHSYPDERSQLGACREYFNRAMQELSRLGVDGRSEEEKAAEVVERRLASLSSASLTLGGEKSYTCKLSVGEAELFAVENGNERSEKTSAEAVLSGFSKLHIGEWRRYYLPRDYGCVKPNPTAWELTLVFNDGGAEQLYSGISVYPYNFSEFLEIFSHMS